MTATSAGAVLRLPRAGGALEPYAPGEPAAFAATGEPATSRVAFAAAHVVADPLGGPGTLDWEATLAFRRHLWAHGLAVAEAMDTAQRGMGLGWETARELIRRSAAEAGGRIAAGAGTDHATPTSVDAVRAAYEEQCEVVEGAGAQAIVMASRALVQVARDADDYRAVYRTVLAGLERPAILHWLGDMFDPALRGYWGSDDLDEASEVFLDVVAENAAKVDGVKVSLLDAGREIALRRRLPDGVRVYTGDDFNYPELIAGDELGHWTRCSACSTRSPRQRPRRWPPSTRATARPTTGSSSRPCRWPASCSRRQPSTTRPGSCSWRSSTATRTTSGWSAGWRARGRSSTCRTCSCWPTAPACCATRR